MFEDILEELSSAKGPVTVRELAKRLRIEEGALEGMLDFLERKGRLTVLRPGDCAERGAALCVGCAYGKGCRASVVDGKGSSGKGKGA